MSSGTYFPPPVKAVEIPKAHGGHENFRRAHCWRSGGPDCGRCASGGAGGTSVSSGLLRLSAEAVGTGCGRSLPETLLEVRLGDRFGHPEFFDSVRWDLVVKAVEKHTEARWVVLYVKRWLAADLQMPDGSLLARDRGTP